MVVQHRAVRAAAWSVVLAAGVAPAMAQSQIRSFAEAEGFGSTVTGGRGGTTVYHVTNLNDSGAGSFRDAVAGSNRIIVFDVGGVINLKSAVSAKSNLTILGQTAPGGGISINGYETSFYSATNVIARYLRFRPGDNSPEGDDAVATSDGDLMLDHDSLEFAKWNNIDAVATSSSKTPHVTIQNSVIADPLSNGTSHTGQGFGAHLEASLGQYTLVNNLWANSHNRNPLAKVNEQFVNNVEYNNVDGYTTGNTGGNFKHDIVNNTFIWGPATNGNSFFQTGGSGTQKYYSTGNIEDSDRNGTLGGSTVNPPATSNAVFVTSPNFSTTAALPTLSTADAYDFVVNHVGASLSRDQLDSLVIGQVQTLGNAPTGYGAGTAGPDETTDPDDSVHTGMYHSAASTGLSNGGLGTITVATRPAGFDSDNDGVADAWETAHGMNPSDASDAFALNPLGYLMIEQYANELGSTNDTTTWMAPSGAWGTAGNWSGGAAPAAMDYAQVRGNGTTNGAVSLSSGTAVAMTLSIGGNGPAAGEHVSVSGSGALNVYDTITVGDQGNAALDISGGSVSAYNVQLGNTLSGVTSTGTLNLSGGTLSVVQLVLGGGTPGAWTTGGSMNWSGGTLRAAGGMTVNVPIALSGAGGTLDSNGFDGVVSGVLSGNGGITKKGAGTITLSGANTYTGVTKISGGALAVSALSNAGVAGNLGAASSDAANLVLDGGTLKYAGTTSTSTDRLLTLTQNGGTLDAGSTGAMNFLGTGRFAATGTGDRSLILTGTSVGSTFASDLADPAGGGKTSLVKNGTGRWILTTPTGGRTYSGDTVVNAGTLLGYTANVLPYGAGKGNLVINAGGVFEMNNNDLAVNALTGAGNINQRGSGARTLTVGNGDASGTFTGTITNSPLSGQGTLNLVKTGAGTQTLAAVNTYAGTTTVDQGTLRVNGSINNTPVTVAGGTLGGTGSALSLTVDPAGTVAPGNSIGSMSIVQDAAIGGHFAVQLDGSGAGSADLLRVGGLLDLTGGEVDFSTVAGGLTPDDPAYVFATYGALTGTFATITGLPTSYAIDYAYDNGTSANNVALVFAPAPVPEPATVSLIAIGAVVGLGRRRRRRAAT